MNNKVLFSLLAATISLAGCGGGGGGAALLWSNLPGHLNRWKIHHLRSITWQNNEKRSIP
ncbi:hypothetical protein AAKU55_002379, partial [Oxalobacteraceae bacterium GrIS 1.11]